jgi:hypothetical protein
MNSEFFTKKDVKDALEAAGALFDGLPKTRQGSYSGFFNELCLFLEAAYRVAAEDSK